MELNKGSIAKLKGVHPDLVRVVKRAAVLITKDPSFIITCGPRTLAEQKILVKRGASKTLKSRHIPAKNGFSHAVDLAAVIEEQIKWDWPLYRILAKVMKEAAKLEKVPLEWGGDWKSWQDGPHFQLPWAKYPGN